MATLTLSLLFPPRRYEMNRAGLEIGMTATLFVINASVIITLVVAFLLRESYEKLRFAAHKVSRVFSSSTAQIEMATLNIAEEGSDAAMRGSAIGVQINPISTARSASSLPSKGRPVLAHSSARDRDDGEGGAFQTAVVGRDDDDDDDDLVAAATFDPREHALAQSRAEIAALRAKNRRKKFIAKLATIDGGEAAVTTRAADLPRGWAALTDGDGNTYYRNAEAPLGRLERGINDSVNRINMAVVRRQARQDERAARAASHDDDVGIAMGCRNPLSDVAADVIHEL